MALKIRRWSPNLVNLLSSGEYSDLEIVCQDHVFKVHKAIMATASPFFKAAISIGTKESVDNSVTFPDHEPEIVARVLIMIYAGVYESENIRNGLAGEILQFTNVEDKYANAVKDYEKDCQLLIKIYSLANYLMLSNFKKETRRILLAAIYNSRKSPFDENDEEDSEQSRDYNEEEGSILAKTVHLVYSETDPSDWTLRDIVVKQALEVREFFHALNTENFQKLLREVPDFAIDIASSKIGRVGKCGYCKHWVWARLTRCPCGRLIGCPDQNCNDERSERSLCVRCVKHNVVKFTPESQALGLDDSDLESDDDVEEQQQKQADGEHSEDEEDEKSESEVPNSRSCDDNQNNINNTSDEDDYVEWLRQLPFRV